MIMLTISILKVFHRICSVFLLFFQSSILCTPTFIIEPPLAASKCIPVAYTFLIMELLFQRYSFIINAIAEKWQLIRKFVEGGTIC